MTKSIPILFVVLIFCTACAGAASPTATIQPTQTVTLSSTPTQIPMPTEPQNTPTASAEDIARMALYEVMKLVKLPSGGEVSLKTETADGEVRLLQQNYQEYLSKPTEMVLGEVNPGKDELTITIDGQERVVALDTLQWRIERRAYTNPINSKQETEVKIRPFVVDGEDKEIVMNGWGKWVENSPRQIGRLVINPYSLYEGRVTVNEEQADNIYHDLLWAIYSYDQASGVSAQGYLSFDQFKAKAESGKEFKNLVMVTTAPEDAQQPKDREGGIGKYNINLGQIVIGGIPVVPWDQGVTSHTASPWVGIDGALGEFLPTKLSDGVYSFTFRKQRVSDLHGADAQGTEVLYTGLRSDDSAERNRQALEELIGDFVGKLEGMNDVNDKFTKWYNTPSGKKVARFYGISAADNIRDAQANPGRYFGIRE